MNVLIDVDGGGYLEACDAFYDANHGVVDAVTRLSSSVGGDGGMAGTDTGGEAWAAQYDPAAAQGIQAGCDLGQSLATMANLLNASLINHDAADGGAMLSAPPGVTGQSGDHDPDHWTEELYAATPASAKGGTGDQPGWWHWIAGHVEGLLWPDADTGELRSAGTAWKGAGDTIDGYKYDAETASAMVGAQKSPEVHDAVAACDEIARHVGDLAAAYRSIGQACTDYAQAVDDHHQEIEEELKSFIEWTIAIEAGGAILGVLTLGAGEGAAQAAEAAEVANAGSRVVRILKSLIEVARTVATTIGRALTKIGEIAGKLGKFLNPKIEQALVKLGVKEAEELFPKLATDAKQLQKKFKHAKDFGVEGNYSVANAKKFDEALHAFVEDPATTTIRGTYHGDPAVISYSDATQQVVIRDLDGNFVSGWGPMTPGQYQHVTTTGSLGGG